MQNTLSIFEERKAEIEFYFSVIKQLDTGNSGINTSNNTRFYKIMKSNFLLMLYNLVEACIVNGIMEIYESVKDEGCTYDQVINELQSIWIRYKIKQVYGTETNISTYEKQVKGIIKMIADNTVLIIPKGAVKISGNLDAKKIKEICDMHKIRYHLQLKGEKLELVKRERNNLAHGDVSFSDCARDLTIGDLTQIKRETIIFISDILAGMKKYYDEKQYKIRAIS